MVRNIQSDEFYNTFANVLIAEISNTNVRVRIANRLADVFEQVDTPDTFNRTAWIEQVRVG